MKKAPTLSKRQREAFQKWLEYLFDHGYLRVPGPLHDDDYIVKADGPKDGPAIISYPEPS
jgi:hypothetical protein